MNAANLVVAVTLTLAAPVASATIIAADDFSYTTGGLSGQNGGAGWASAWVAATSGVAVVNPAIDLSGDRALAFTANNNSMASRSLGSAFSGSELFVSFLIQVPQGTSINRNDFLGFWFGSSAGPNIGIKGNQDSATATNDIFARTTGSAGSFVPGSDIVTNMTYQLVGRLSKSASLYNKFEIWLDPVLGDLLSPDAVFGPQNSNISSISSIGFRTANLDTGDTILFDQLRLTTTWNEAVPEPGTLALLGLGLTGLAAIRRKKPAA